MYSSENGSRDLKNSFNLNPFIDEYRRQIINLQLFTHFIFFFNLSNSMFSLTKPLILASNSPRRKQLLKETGFDFKVQVLPTDETYPDDLSPDEVAGHIAYQKAEMFRNDENRDKLILTADTVVIADGLILGKPADPQDAFSMLKMMSGNVHQVVTAVSLLTQNTITTVSDKAFVSFLKLDDAEINLYINRYKPFDKAGSYGIQEWIGMIGIERIEGSFYTIMGLPVHLVYQLLKPYINTSSS
jgi:septum formation protein